jgi:hypothetical protein
VGTLSLVEFVKCKSACLSVGMLCSTEVEKYTNICLWECLKLKKCNACLFVGKLEVKKYTNFHLSVGTLEVKNIQILVCLWERSRLKIYTNACLSVGMPEVNKYTNSCLSVVSVCAQS